MSRSPDLHSARWPFWLLIVAWGCANSPQAATYAFLTWVAEARTFSHQQRLTVDVAYLLVGEKAPVRDLRTDDASPVELPPAVPPDAVLKKLPLALERIVESLPPDRGSVGLRALVVICPDAVRRPPLLGPPRTNPG